MNDKRVASELPIDMTLFFNLSYFTSSLNFVHYLIVINIFKIKKNLSDMSV